MNFKVGSIKDYNRKFPHYVQPMEIGHFSTDSENRFCDDDHQLKYLSLPDKLTGLHMDLNEGYSQYVGVYNDEEKSYDKLLKWIISHEDAKKLLSSEDLKREVDFVCRRGVLTSINSTLYEKHDDLLIYATKFRSVIYLSRPEAEQKQQREQARSEKEQKILSWVFKFEQYITSDTMHSKPNTTLPVNVNEKYFAVTKGTLENHRILFSGEMDAVDPQYMADSESGSKSMNQFVEMKTSGILKASKQKYQFKLKLLKWYLQCFISGIPRLVCGFRNSDGIVEEIKVFNVSDLPGMAGGLWSAAACLNFCCRFLTYVKECVVKDDPKIVYKFYWRPGSTEVTCEELNAEHQFLPEWYIKSLQK